jgi:hypothetical protein
VVRAKADDPVSLPVQSPERVCTPPCEDYADRSFTGPAPADGPAQPWPRATFACDQVPGEAIPEYLPHGAPETGAHGGPPEGFASAAGPGSAAECIYGSAEYLLWWIRDSRVPPLVTTGPASSQGILGQPGTTILLGGSPLSNDERSGGRFTLGYWLDNCKTLGIEGSFFFLGEESVPFRFSSNQFPLLARPFFNLNAGQEFVQIATSPGVSTGSVTTELSSQLWGAEANLRTNVCCGCNYRVDLLGGLRYLDLREGLHITEDLMALSGPFAGSHIIVADRFDTHNQFFGGQLGAVAEFHQGPWSLDVKGKLALGFTHEVIDINGAQIITSPTGAQSVFTGGLLALNSNIGHFSRNHFAVVPELGVNLGYQFTDHLRVFGGYNFLWWSNVVRPGDQIDRGLDVTRIPNFGVAATPLAQARPAVLFKETDFWAQGINFGLEFKW